MVTLPMDLNFVPGVYRKDILMENQTPQDKGASGLVPRLSVVYKNMLIISVTEQNRKSHYAYQVWPQTYW